MKRQAIAIGSVVAVGLGLLVFMQAANAAETGCQINGGGPIVNPCPKDDAMKLCKNAARINGVDQQREGVGTPGFPSDTCDFRVTEVLGADDASPIFGPPFSPSAPLVNCPPNESEKASIQVTMETGAARISGEFVNDDDTFSANFLALIDLEWGKKTTRSKTTTEVRTVSSTREVTVPKGKKGTFEFVPRRAQIKGTWTITGGTRGGGPFAPDPIPWETTFDTTIDAPLVLPGGSPDGEARPNLTNCDGHEFDGDDPDPFPSEAPK